MADTRSLTSQEMDESSIEKLIEWITDPNTIYMYQHWHPTMLSQWEGGSGPVIQGETVQGLFLNNPPINEVIPTADLVAPDNRLHPQELSMPIPPGWEGPLDKFCVEFRSKGRLGISMSKTMHRRAGLDNACMRDFDPTTLNCAILRLRIWVSINVDYVVLVLTDLYVIQWPEYQWPGNTMDSAEQISVKERGTTVTRERLAQLISSKISMYIQINKVTFTCDQKTTEALMTAIRING